MFYSNCPKCGFSRRWLTKAESEDEEIVKSNRKIMLTAGEVVSAAAEVDKVIEVCCLDCEPPPKEKKSKAKKKAV